MAKNIQLQTRLWIGFGTLTAFLFLLAGASYIANHKNSKDYNELLDKYHPIAQHSVNIEIDLLTARRHEKDFLARRDPKYIEKLGSMIELLHNSSASISSLAKELKLEGIQSSVIIVETKSTAYHNGFSQLADLVLQQGDKTSGIRGTVRAKSHEIEALIKKLKSDTLMVDYLNMRRHEKDFILREDVKYRKAMRDRADMLLAKLSREIPKNTSLREHFINEVEAYVAGFNGLVDNIMEMKTIYPEMKQAAHDVETTAIDIDKMIEKLVTEKQAAVLAAESFINRIILIISIILVITSITTALFTTRSISKVLEKNLGTLRNGSAEIDSAAHYVSNASQSLAHGTSEQAASLQESAAGLEEMAAMTKQNFANTQSAQTLMNDSGDSIEKATDRLGDLTQAIKEISDTSEEILKIVRTIDEIAFQTNILALNAAVEAARAGEAGAGFAVVADEVRGLAGRAADAAQNTTQLIDATLSKISRGSEIVDITNDAFQAVGKTYTDLAQLVTEINKASSQNSDGISRLNTSVTGIDNVVQSNTAAAEESASAAEELASQVSVLNTVIRNVAEFAGLKEDSISSTVGFNPQEAVSREFVTAATQPNSGFVDLQNDSFPKEAHNDLEIHFQGGRA